MIQSDACLVNGRMRGPQDTLSLPSKNGVQGPKDNPSIFGNIESTDNPTIVDGLLGGAEDTSGIFGNIDSESHEGTLIPPKKSFTNTTKTLL
jgi:hypothetical protein